MVHIGGVAIADEAVYGRHPQKLSTAAMMGPPVKCRVLTGRPGMLCMPNMTSPPHDYVTGHRESCRSARWSGFLMLGNREHDRDDCDDDHQDVEAQGHDGGLTNSEVVTAAGKRDDAFQPIDAAVVGGESSENRGRYGHAKRGPKRRGHFVNAGPGSRLFRRKIGQSSVSRGR